MSNQIKAQEAKFINWYHNFKDATDAEIDNRNLARATNPKLDQIIKAIEKEFKIIDDRVKSGKTFCLIFDSKRNESDTVTDALIGENITAKLDPDQEYYIKGDKKTKVVKMVQRKDEKSNEISKVIVPTKLWPTLEELRLTLSPNKYSEFLQKCQDRHYFIDSLVVTLNSVKELHNDDIKMLLKKVHECYPDPFILLNDAPQTDCTMMDDCDTCYEKSRSFLRQIQINEDKFEKISATSTIRNDESKKTLNENFERIKKLLEEEVKMENVVRRFLLKSDIFMNNFEEIERLINEDQTNVKKTTELYEQKMKDKKIETEASIDESKITVEMELDKMNETENTKCLNNNFVKNNIEPMIDLQFVDLRRKIRTQILETIRDNNPDFESYISNMFEGEYLNPKDYELKLKDDIEKCMEEIVENLRIADEEARQDRSMFSRFLTSTKTFLTNTCESIKSAFDRFVGQFKDKILEKYQQFEIRIKEAKKEFQTCLLKDRKDEIQNSLAIIKNKIINKGTSIRISINEKINTTTIKEIKSKDGININQNDITNCLTLSRTISNNVSNVIGNNLQQLKNEIVHDIERISSNAMLKTWAKELSDYYMTTHFQNTGGFENRCEEIISKLYKDLKDNQYYSIKVEYVNQGYDIQFTEHNEESRLPGVIIGATIGSVVPVVGTFVGGIIGSFFKTTTPVMKAEPVQRPQIRRENKYIKLKEMLGKVNNEVVTLQNYSDAIIKGIELDFNAFLRTKDLMV